MSRPLNHLAASQAERDPTAIAVVLGEERMTYAELVAAGRRLAGLLIGVGLEQGDRAALLVPKSPAAIVAMHAVLEAGGAYVPIDLASPPARAASIVYAAQPRVILAAGAAAGLLDGLEQEGALAGVTLISVDPEWAGGERPILDHAAGDWAHLTDEPLGIDRGPEALAHILFTSGSTGAPKGVQITHGMVNAFVEWAISHFGTAAGDRISGHPPLHFDLSTFDIYATLGAGAELHLVPAAANLVPRALADFIRSNELKQWFSVPSTLAYMVAAGAVADGDFPALERVLFCGEAMPTPVLSEWMRRVPHARYTNLYGPTETTIASSYYDVAMPPVDETDSVPIGRPCEGEELLLLDDERQPVSVGEIGQIFIGGVGVSPGYWRDEEKTLAAFGPGPNGTGRIYATGDLGWAQPDGVFRYVGRVDSQIKHRGYRIELGEIEAALNALGNVRECAVVAVATDGFEATAICCAFVPASRNVTPVSLRTDLRSSLPTYMLPTKWRTIDVLPKNANGKIDRRAVKEWFEAESEHP